MKVKMKKKMKINKNNERKWLEVGTAETHCFPTCYRMWTRESCYNSWKVLFCCFFLST